MKKFLKYWLPALAWAALIFYVSSNKVPSTSTVFWQDLVAKKSAHVFEYIVFTLLFYRAFLNSKFENKKAAIYAVLLAIFYGATDELHQFFTPGRNPAIRDVIIDSVASTLFMCLIVYILPKMPERIKKLAKYIEIY